MNARWRTLIWTLAIAGILRLSGTAVADPGDDQYTVAAAHFSAQRWELAVTEFQSLLDQFPTHHRAGEATFYLGESLVQLHRYRDAADRFAKVVDDKTVEQLAQRAWYRRGEALYLTGDSKAAEPVLRQFVDKYRDDVLNDHALPFLAMSTLRLERPAEAEKLFDQALARFPAGPFADLCRLGRAEASENLKQTDEAAKRYEALLSAPANTTARLARLRLGTLQYRAGRYTDAAKVLKPLADDRDFPELKIEARYWLGMSHLAAGDAQAALDIFLPWADRSDPRIDEIRLRAGTALSAVGRRADAQAMFGRVSEKSEWADQALWGQIQVIAADENDAEMNRLCDQFHEKFAGSPLASHVTEALARRLTQRQQYDSAIALLKKRLEEHTPKHERHMQTDFCGPKSHYDPKIACRKCDKNVQKGEVSRRFRYLLAVAYVGGHRYDEALKELDAVVRSADPELKARALASQGAVLIALGRHAEAEAPLLACLNIHPDGSDAAACRGNLAVCYARTKRLDEARKIDSALQKSCGGHVSRPAATLALAEASLAAGDAKWAGALFTRLAESKGCSPELKAQSRLGVARSQAAAGNSADATATVDKLLATTSPEPLAAETSLALCQILEKLGQREQALQAYLALIEKHPRNASAPAAMLRTATLYEAQSQRVEAIAMFDRLIAEYGDAAEVDAALYQSAWLLRGENRKQEALTHFRTLHEKYPKSRYWPDATYRLAEAALESKQYAEVRRLVSVLVSAQPRPELLAHALYVDSQRAVAEEKWVEVEAALTQLVDKAPQNQLRLPAEFWLAEAAYRQEHFDEARRRFSEVAGKAQGHTGPWLATIPLRQAQLAALDKDWATTRRLTDTIRKTWPDFAQLYEVDYLVGRLLVAEARFDEARDAFHRVTASDHGGKTETAAMAQWMIGESFLHQQQYERALREYLRVESLYSYPRWQAAALLQAGKCDEFLGRWTEAVALYERIVKQYGKTKFSAEAEQRLRAAQQRVALKRT